jgi:hypothetical protein
MTAAAVPPSFLPVGRLLDSVRLRCAGTATPPTRGLLVERLVSQSDPGYASYACRPCWNSTVGGDGCHLRVLRQGPQ